MADNNERRSRTPLRTALGISFTAVLATLVATGPAHAHVKWFAPYVVGAAPAPIADTLTNGWFWLGIALVLVFFTAAVLVERSPSAALVNGIVDFRREVTRVFH